MTKPDNQKRAKASDIIGGLQAKKSSRGTAETNNNFNGGSYTYITELVPTIPKAVVADSGCISRLNKSSIPCEENNSTVTGLRVGIPNVP